MGRIKYFIAFVLTILNTRAATVIVPTPIIVPSASSAATSFSYNGMLTQADSISFSVAGNPTDPCLQSGSTYCTNAAGVVTVAGSSAAGAATTFSGTFNGTSNTWDFGALLLEISGVGTVQLFPANAANGYGSGSPPASLTLPLTPLSSLGFGSFSVVNPTFGFVLADTLYSDNSGSFLITTASPEPSTFLLLALGVIVLAVVQVQRSRRASR